MAKIPIVEIPIDDRAFQKFIATFEAYDKRLEAMPGKWQAVSKEFRAATASVLAQNAVMRSGGIADPGKLRQVEHGWRNIASWSGTVLSNAARITGQLLRWGTLFGGGLLGGSLFGIDRMANSMSSSRYSYMGLGMRYGDWRSFGLNMSRLVDPQSFLSSINAAASNPALQAPLYALGVSPQGSTEQIGISMLKAMRQLALNTPRGELGLMSDAYGLGPYGGLETLMRLRTMSASEFYKQLQHERQDKNSLGLPPGVARRWVDFTNQMDRAKSMIFKTFVVGLAPLEKPLERLSVAFSGFLSKLLSGPALKKGIDELAHFFDTFNGTLGSPRFLHAAEELTTDIEKLAAVLGRFLGHPTNPGAGNHVGGATDWWRKQKEFWSTGIDPIAYNNGYGDAGKLKKWLGSLDRANGFPAGTMERLAQTESHLNANAVSPKGAMGMFQLMPGTARMLGVSDPYDVVQSGRASAHYLATLVKHYHGSLAEALGAYNWGSNNMDAALARAARSGQGVRLPPGVQKYITAISPDSGIIVTARHKAGASAVLAAAGLAGGAQ